MILPETILSLGKASMSSFKGTESNRCSDRGGVGNGRKKSNIMINYSAGLE